MSIEASSVRKVTWAVLSALLVGWSAIAWSVLSDLRSADPADAVVVMDQDLNGGTVTDAMVSGTWTLAQDGLALQPGQSGQVTLRILRQARPMRVGLWFYAGGGLRTRVECSVDGQRFQVLARDRSWNGETVGLGNCGTTGDIIWLRLSAENTVPEAGLRLALDKIQVVTGTSVDSDPRVPLWAGLTMLAGLVVWCAFVRPSGWLVATGLSLATLTGCAVFAADGLSTVRPILGLPLDGAWLSCGVLLATIWLRAWRQPPGSSPRDGLERLSLAWVLGIAAVLRWTHLVAVAARPLDPDAITVVKLADSMRFLYDTSFREPLWLWAYRVFRMVIEHPEMSARVYSLAGSLALVLLTSCFAWRYFRSALIGLLVAWLMAGHSYFIESAARGLRTELYALGLMGVLWFAFLPGPTGLLRTIGLALTTAATLLTQLSGGVVILPLLALAAWLRRIRLRDAVVALATAAVLVTPYLLQSRTRFGDPLWSLNVHAIFYRNYEFKSNCQGCPPADVLAHDSYAGDHVTMTQYVFGMHSIREVVHRIVDGYLTAFVRPSSLLYQLLGWSGRVAWLAYLVGTLLLLAGRGRELLLLPWLSVNLLAFIIPIGMDPRLVMHAAPVMVIAMARPVLWLTSKNMLTKGAA